MRPAYMAAGVSQMKRQIIAFGGVNYSLKTNDGELSESLELSSARYPCLSQRAGRKSVGGYTDPTGLYARGELCVVDGTDFKYGGRVVGQVEEGEKLFATINSKIVIFPDKVYYDTEADEFGSLSAGYPSYGGDVEFKENTLSVSVSERYIDQAGEMEEQVTGLSGGSSITAYTSASVDKSSGAITMSGGTDKTVSTLAAGDLIWHAPEDHTKYMTVSYSAEQSDGSYIVGGTVHTAVKHAYQDFDGIFKVGDGVEISGCTSYAANNGTRIVKGVSGRTLTFADGTFTAGTEAGGVKIERKVPDFVCICECDNRIWGAEGTTIYASALGDPTNFFVYDGLSTDSYAVAVGSDGEFTGCIAYSSTVLFFKEGYLHRVLGGYPAQYEIYTVPGIQKGSEKSLTVINETLFYKGRNGVYAYSGGTPELISACFGPRRFEHGIGGTDGERYYLSMQTETGNWELYAFDILRGVWLREDAVHAVDFAFLDGTLYFLDGGSRKIIAMGQIENEDGPIQWSATLCQMDEVVHGRKGYSRLYLRADLEAGAWLKVEISPDGAPFRQVYLTHNQRDKTMTIPILPVRCDNFAIRLSGKGWCFVKSLVREFTVGSEY